MGSEHSFRPHFSNKVKTKSRQAHLIPDCPEKAPTATFSPPASIGKKFVKGHVVGNRPCPERA